MGGHDERGASASLLTEVAAHVCSRDRVEARGGLVAEDPVGLVQRSPDQRHFLRHAPRVRREDGVGSIGEVEALEELVDLLRASGFRYAVEIAEAIEILHGGVAAVEAGLVRDHAKARSYRVQVVGQTQAVEIDEACIRPQDPAQTAQRRRLARPVLPEEHEQLAAFDMKVDAIDGANVGKRLTKALDQDHDWSLDSSRGGASAFSRRSTLLARFHRFEQRLQPIHDREVDALP